MKNQVNKKSLSSNQLILKLIKDGFKPVFCDEEVVVFYDLENKSMIKFPSNCPSNVIITDMKLLK